jgi:hypothetical protein
MASSTPPLPSISGRPRPVPVLASERLPVPLDELLVVPPDWEDWLDIVDIEDWLDIVDMLEDACATAATAPAAAGPFGAAEALPPTSTNIAPIEKSVATRQVAIFGTGQGPQGPLELTSDF